MERSHLSIGEVLSLLRDEFPDVTISKIRFLESQGLVDPERTPSGYRKFYDNDVDRLRWILRQQREHFLPLKVIRGRLTDQEDDPGQLEGGGGVEELEGAGSNADQALPAAPEPVPGEPSELMPGGRPEPGAEAPTQPPTTEAAGSTGTADPGPDVPPPRPAATTPTLFAELGTHKSDPAATGQARPVDVPHPAGEEPGADPDPPTRPAIGPSDRPSDRPTTGAQRPLPGPPGPGRALGPGRPPPSRRGPGAGRSPGAGRHSAPTPVAAVDPTPAPPAPAPAGVEDLGAESDSYTAEELAVAAGVTPELVDELRQYGLIGAQAVVAGVPYFDKGALAVSRTAGEFAEHGVEVRHLRTWRNAADREADLFQQVVLPLLRQRNPQSRRQALETLADLVRLGGELRSALVSRATREIR